LGALIGIGFTRADPDLWGHLRFGQDILALRALPGADPYSFTADRPWVNHEWLAEVFFAAAYAAGGPAGAIALKLLMAAATLVLLLRTYRNDGATGHTLFMVGALVVVAVLPRVQYIRPQLFSVLLFAALVATLRTADRGRSRALWLQLPIMALWANTHGGWIVGAATMGAWTLGRIWQQRRDPKSWLVPLAACAGGLSATLINPYGVELWTFLQDTVGPSRQFLTEWGPLIAVPQLLLLWLVFAGLAIWSLVRTGLPANVAYALIPLAWGVASLRVSRLDSFFALSVLGFLGAPLIGWLNARGERRASADPATPVHSPRLVVSIVCVVCLLALPFWPTLTCIRLDALTMPEPQAMRFIRSNALRGRMVTFFDWGEYAIWHVPPGLRISMDGRRETVYRDVTIDNHFDFYLGSAAGLAYVNQLDADYVWLPNMLPAVNQLQHSGWSPIFDGPLSTVLARHGVPRTLPAAFAEEAATPAPPSWRCFPGP
jgi:hypothetical protein